jgi:hypothetical protein
MKVDRIPKEMLLAAIEKLEGIEILDVREA